MKKIDTIRQAVLAHHGGFEKAEDHQIMLLWNSLDEPTRQRYLANIKEKSKTKNPSD